MYARYTGVLQTHSGEVFVMDGGTGRDQPARGAGACSLHGGVR